MLRARHVRCASPLISAPARPRHRQTRRGREAESHLERISERDSPRTAAWGEILVNCLRRIGERRLQETATATTALKPPPSAQEPPCEAGATRLWRSGGARGADDVTGGGRVHTHVCSLVSDK